MIIHDNEPLLTTLQKICESKSLGFVLYNVKICYLRFTSMSNDILIASLKKYNCI